MYVSTTQYAPSLLLLKFHAFKSRKIEKWNKKHKITKRNDEVKKRTGEGFTTIADFEDFIAKFWKQI